MSRGVLSRYGRRQGDKNRAERVGEVRALREQGLKPLEIASRLGLAHTYVYSLLNDPSGEKERTRKRGYSRPCPNCGKPMEGSDGWGLGAPTLCANCFALREADRNQLIFAAWEAGEPVSEIAVREGLREGAVRSRIARHREEEELPLRRLRSREAWPLIERRWRQGALAREIASECGTTEASVYEMLKRMRLAGIDVPRRQPKGER
jgi:hypothetical protein